MAGVLCLERGGIVAKQMVTEVSRGFRYAAYISYDRRDEAFARRLHRLLEAYRIPEALVGPERLPKRNRIYPVFRTREGLPTGALSDEVEHALTNSYCIIVVGSPDAAKSSWIAQEVNYFVEQHGGFEHVHLITSRGPIGAEHNDCYPPILRKTIVRGGVETAGFVNLPSDARARRGGSRRAFTSLVAKILMQPRDYVVEAEQQRERWAWVQGIGVLLILAALGLSVAPPSVVSSFPSMPPYFFVSGTALFAVGVVFPNILRMNRARVKGRQDIREAPTRQGAIFIGYRRQDTADAAGRIFENLEAAFGAPRLFKDVDSIPAGTFYRTYIPKIVAKCEAFLVLIGPAWIDCRDSDGRRRLDDPQDLVRIEIETALATPGLAVIPVLVSGAPMPSSDLLPDTLKPLRDLQALQVRRDPDYKRDIERLIAQLRAKPSRSREL